MLTLNRRSILAAATALAAAGGGERTVFAQAEYTPGSLPKTFAKKNPQARNVTGKMLYIGDENNERGREWFSYSFREDGQITVRAYTEIDDGRVERDVIYTMTDKFRPLDCFVRVTVKGKFVGTGWIRVTDTQAECEVFNVTMGRVSQVVPLATPAIHLGSHPLVVDAIGTHTFDHSRPEKIQRRPGNLSSSPTLDGSTGPFLTVSSGENVTEYIGKESIKTSVGTFEAHHYRWPSEDRRHPSGTVRSQDMWVTHPDYIFVRGEVRGYLNNKTGFGRYELVEYQA